MTRVIVWNLSDDAAEALVKWLRDNLSGEHTCLGDAMSDMEAEPIDYQTPVTIENDPPDEEEIE